MSKPLKILVTGAAGQIASSMIPLIAGGNVFGAKQPVILHLLEITPALKRLQGIVMEIEDCAYDLVEGVVFTDKIEEAYKDIDWAIMIGGFSVKGSWKNFERSSLLSGNVPIFSEAGKSLEKYAKKTVKVVVVANPANTNALITMKYAPSIPKENFSALSRLDFNRGISLIARKLGVKNTDVKNVSVWGNHSRTMLADVSGATVKGKCVKSELNDDEFIRNEFREFIRGRFYDVVEFKGATSSISAANAVKDHIRDWHFGTAEGEHVGMGVISDGNPYGFAEGVFFSFPVSLSGGKWKIVEGFKFNEEEKKLLKATEEELLAEKKTALEFCKD